MKLDFYLVLDSSGSWFFDSMLLEWLDVEAETEDSSFDPFFCFFLLNIE
jgi:hypothetical protein